MTAAQIGQQARQAYGLDASSDARFTDAVMLDLVNRAHHWITALALPYYKDFTTNLTQATALFQADGTVIAMDRTGLRAKISTVWTALRWLHRSSLVSLLGTPDALASGTPRFWTTYGGAASGAGRQFELWPPSSEATVSNGLKYAAWVYAADLASGDSPVLPTAEHQLLVAPTCFQMAQYELALGGDVKIAHWLENAQNAALQLARTVQLAHPGTPNIALGDSGGKK